MRMKVLIALLMVVFPLWSHAKLKAGEPFPLAGLSELKDLKTGKTGFNTASLKGKVVLVDFWASWCGPCKQALPAYDALAKKYGKNGFVVLGINVDEEATEGNAFLKEHPVGFFQLFDSGKKLVEKVGVETMPTSFLINKKGVVSTVHLGYRNGDDAHMNKTLVKLLKEK